MLYVDFTIFRKGEREKAPLVISTIELILASHPLKLLITGELSKWLFHLLNILIFSNQF